MGSYYFLKLYNLTLMSQHLSNNWILSQSYVECKFENIFHFWDISIFFLQNFICLILQYLLEDIFDAQQFEINKNEMKQLKMKFWSQQHKNKKTTFAINWFIVRNFSRIFLMTSFSSHPFIFLSVFICR